MNFDEIIKCRDLNEFFNSMLYLPESGGTVTTFFRMVKWLHYERCSEDAPYTNLGFDEIITHVEDYYNPKTVYIERCRAALNGSFILGLALHQALYKDNKKISILPCSNRSFVRLYAEKLMDIINYMNSENNLNINFTIKKDAPSHKIISIMGFGTKTSDIEIVKFENKLDEYSSFRSKSIDFIAPLDGCYTANYVELIDLVAPILHRNQGTQVVITGGGVLNNPFVGNFYKFRGRLLDDEKTIKILHNPINLKYSDEFIEREKAIHKDNLVYEREYLCNFMTLEKKKEEE